MNCTDESYYLALAILDRIDNEREKRGLSRVEFSEFLGKSKPYWNVQYASARGYRLDTLNALAEKLNISLEYLIYGRKYGKYENKKYNLNKISDYTKGKIVYLSRSEAVIVSLLRHRKQTSISMNVFYKLEKKLKLDLWSLISE